MTLILPMDPLRPDHTRLEEAARIIRSGGTVVFPTETVYGLGADATSDRACKSIFEAKGRPADNPLIVHFSSIDEVRSYADVPDEMIKPLERFWPGPVSFVFTSSGRICRVARADLDTVAVRIPAHPVALALIQMSGVPIAAPSANLSGRPSIVSGKTAIQDLDGRVDAIIDAGNSFFGLESTVLVRRKDYYELLRPGSLDPDQISKILGRIEVSPAARGLIETERPLTPGMKYLHYSPKKELFRIEDIDEFVDYVNNVAGPRTMIICSLEVGKRIHRETHSLGSEKNPYDIARNLFPSFRALDEMDYASGIIHSFREEGIGLAIMNRIRKASKAVSS